MTDKVIKSVDRVFKILELFERERRPLTGIEVARQLGYPHTSTLALLKSMQTLGYMSHDIETWTFLPSLNLPQLLDWVANSFQNERAILSVIAELNGVTGETINMSRQMGEFIRIIYGLESTKTVAIRVQQGVAIPINASHTGMVALACHPDKEVTRITKQLKSSRYKEARDMSVEQVLEEVAVIREQKFAPGYEIYLAGIGAVCFPVKAADGGRPFIIGVVGPSDRIRSNEERIVEAAKVAIANHGVELGYSAN